MKDETKEKIMDLARDIWKNGFDSEYSPEDMDHCDQLPVLEAILDRETILGH